ncbi:hypothetical protein AD953_03125 [Acetobacter malorum]|uniref:Uncharacterized protein n=1 Tax=Acetobacter malorum TaxID=178901 RepID=A0A149VGB0_9PROT|nr:hypothetical protein AD953_03125 [Acetobacter malorum]
MFGDFEKPGGGTACALPEQFDPPAGRAWRGYKSCRREGKDAGLAANAPACMTGTGRQRTVPLPMRRAVKQETGDPACLGGKLQPA